MSGIIRVVMLCSALALGCTTNGCSTTTVDVGPGGSGNVDDAEVVSAATICARISALACSAAEDTCTSDLETSLRACSGTDEAKQALLNCLNAAQYDCSGGVPTTHACAGEAASAGCTATGPSDGGVDSALPTHDAAGHDAPTPDATSHDAVAEDTSPTGICAGLCDHGVLTSFRCTNQADQTQFTIAFSVDTSSCVNPLDQPPICIAPSAELPSDLMGLYNVEFDCDHTIQATGYGCTQRGSWSLQGNQLNLNFTAIGFVATCTRE